MATRRVFEYLNAENPLWTINFLQLSVQHVTTQVAQVLNEPVLLRLAERWRGEDTMMAAAAGAMIPILALEGIAAVGFTAGGVAAGSLAAVWQSMIGDVMAGSLFSSLQSVGALGTLGGPVTTACVVAGVAGYTIVKMAKVPKPPERLQRVLERFLSDDDLLAQFWVAIDCWN
ncbi:hypothetical protein CPB86DRAFT_430630 [Serendipita vermifera]|nr:hypothetical protein CPB86DRAFT_430630 [Serendipita vermifera]